MGWQKWGSLWDTAVWCPVSDPISLRIAGSQTEPLCKLLPSSWEGLLTAPQELYGDEDKAFISAPAPKAVILKYGGVMEKKKGRSVWVNHSYFMGALGKRPFSLGLIEMSIDLSHGKRKLGGVSILKFRSSPFEFCVRVQVGYWSFGWDKNPSPSLACANCALCSDAWSLANLFKPSVPKVSLHEGGEKQKTATLSAGLWFTVTWANLVLGAGCHSDMLLM